MHGNVHRHGVLEPMATMRLIVGELNLTEIRRVDRMGKGDVLDVLAAPHCVLSEYAGDRARSADNAVTPGVVNTIGCKRAFNEVKVVAIQGSCKALICVG